MTPPPTTLPAPARPERTAVASEPERPYRLYAMTRHDGPVLLGHYRTPSQRDQAMRRERELHETLGGGEVLGFRDHLDRPTPTDPQAFRQERLL